MIKMVGDWNGARRLTRTMKSTIISSNEIVLKRIGLKAEREMVKWIKSQPADWKPLSESYKNWKRKNKFSDKMLIKSSSMINAITSMVSYPRVFIGVKKSVKDKEGNEIANIAAIMEYGSKARNIPPRPFILPIQKMMLRLIIEEDLFGTMLREHLATKFKLV